LDGDSRAFVGIFGLDDDLTGKAGDIIKLLFHRYTFENVGELDPTGNFGKNRHGVGVPLCKSSSLFDCSTWSNFDLGTIHYGIFFPFAAGFVNYGDLAVAVHNDVVPFVVDYCVDVNIVDHTIGTCLEGGLFGVTGGGTTDVEGTHRQLCPRLTNRLGSDDADRFTHVDTMASGKVASVAFAADATFALAGKHGSDLYLLNPCIFYPLDQILVNFLVHFNQYLIRQWIMDVFKGNSSENTVADRFNNFPSFCQRGNNQAVQCSAIGFSDDRILGDVDQSAGQVARVGRF